MATLRYLTAGESHGKALLGILEGLPSGLTIFQEEIDRELKRRQGGYGRGGRMKIESDKAEILSGVRWGKTLGSPVALCIVNKDYANWAQGMSSDPAAEGSIPPVTKARPGHADLSGAIKYNHYDVRNILERSSARETAAKVALGALAKKFLSAFSVIVGSYVIQIGNRKASIRGIQKNETQLLELFRRAEMSPVRCPDEAASTAMVEAIDQAIKDGNSLGGLFEVFATGLPPGLGSHVHWDRRLDGRLSQALMGTQAIKGVEIGAGFEAGQKPGAEVMDEIFYGDLAIEGETTSPSHDSFYRQSNNAGGIEGGMTNGMPVLLRACMKPIPTLRKPLRSVDIVTKLPVEAAYERSDVCAVPAAAVIGEAVTALTIADAFLEKFGGDSIEEVRRNFDGYIRYVREF